MFRGVFIDLSVNDTTVNAEEGELDLCSLVSLPRNSSGSMNLTLSFYGVWSCLPLSCRDLGGRIIVCLRFYEDNYSKGWTGRTKTTQDFLVFDCMKFWRALYDRVLRCNVKL